METETIAALVLLAAMGCLVLSIYKVKEWYRKNTRTADPDACEQEKVNLKMMEQVRRREQVIKPEPPLDGYAEIAAPFGGHGLLDLKNMLLAVLLFVFYGLAVEYTGTHPFLDGGEKLFYSISPYGSYVLRGHPDISQGVFRVSYIPAGRFDGHGGVQLVLGAALFFSVPDPALQRLRIRVFRRSV